MDGIVGSLKLYKQFDLDDWWDDRERLSHPNKFSKFLGEVLLQYVSEKLVIFVDEIDSVLSLNFKIEDFFAVIRDSYQRRADNSDYERLTFCLIGVTTPGDLIADKRRTPFNIGRAIELTGFKLEEAQPLIQGFADRAENPETLIKEVLYWTGGQPFLTQKLCTIVKQSEVYIAQDEEKAIVQNLVKNKIIDNWEFQDEPEHLRTIRNRLLFDEKITSSLLGLYQQILSELKQGRKLVADRSPEQMKLRLSGLVVKLGEGLQVYNPIYAAVFDRDWVNKQLDNLRPYSENFNAWLASNCEDESRLLRGQALQEAQAWAKGKNLSDFRLSVFE